MMGCRCSCVGSADFNVTFEEEGRGDFMVVGVEGDKLLKGL